MPSRSLRIAAALVLAASLFADGAAAGKPSKARPKPAAKAPLPQAAKADATTVGKAVLAKELPSKLPGAEKAQLEAIGARLKADDFDGAVALYKRWCDASVKPLSREEVLHTALWVFREGVLSRTDELARAGDHWRFADERAVALDDTLALLRGAAITKKPVLVAKLVVPTAYVREARGDEKRERQVLRDNYSIEIQQFEKNAEEAAAERASARSTFDALAPKHTRALQALGALTRAAEGARVPNAK